jgi:hypothetical protein
MPLGGLGDVGGLAAMRRILAAVAVAAGLLLAGCSIDAQSASSRDRTSSAPAGTSSPGESSAQADSYTSDPAWPELRDDAQAARQLVEEYWASTMPAVFGQQFVQVSRFLFYEGELNPPDCSGQPLPPRNAAYCNGEGFVAFDVDWFLENMKSQAGDSSVYVILFHEWGHAIQDQIGGPSLGITYELQADCYAGAALSEVVRNGQLQLEAGDAGEVINILFQGGDPAGTPWLDPDAHGSAEQRIRAFALGDRNGPETCYTTYQ